MQALQRCIACAAATPPLHCSGSTSAAFDCFVNMSSAARTNLTSDRVRLHNNVIGEGAFRLAYAGTYEGGNRNQQEAVCKKFKSKYHMLESEFFAADFKIADRAIQYAEDWNDMCPVGKEILASNKRECSHHQSAALSRRTSHSLLHQVHVEQWLDCR